MADASSLLNRLLEPFFGWDIAGTYQSASQFIDFDFMGKDEKYAKQVYKSSYGMNPYDEGDIKIFVHECLRNEKKTGHIELAEAIATISYLDETAGKNIKDHLMKWGDNLQIKSALRLAGTFSEAYGPNGFSLQPLFDLFGNQKRGDG
ncbi:MAG: hypothetical protein KAS15_04940 [Nanoarchaeota archaeon]|nr:hypothetical protein [Nanoarchaeota archaeon]MCK5630550.1 hypothetical protein [Nanoarchaeota archaeon]